MSSRWLVDILPALCLILVGLLIGSPFEELYLKFCLGMPGGIAAYFLFRYWGLYIVRRRAGKDG